MRKLQEVVNEGLGGLIDVKSLPQEFLKLVLYKNGGEGSEISKSSSKLKDVIKDLNDSSSDVIGVIGKKGDVVVFGITKYDYDDNKFCIWSDTARQGISKMDTYKGNKYPGTNIRQIHYHNYTDYVFNKGELLKKIEEFDYDGLYLIYVDKNRIAVKQDRKQNRDFSVSKGISPETAKKWYVEKFAGDYIEKFNKFKSDIENALNHDVSDIDSILKIQSNILNITDKFKNEVKAVRVNTYEMDTFAEEISKRGISKTDTYTIQNVLSKLR